MFKFPPTALALTLAVCAVGAVATSLVMGQTTTQTAATSRFTTTPATLGNLEKTVDANGSIASSAVWDIVAGSAAVRADANTSTITGTAGVTVRSVAARVGRHVKRGQVLARLDQRVARLRVSAAQTAYDDAVTARAAVTTSSGLVTTTTSPGASGSSPGGASGGSAAATPTSTTSPTARTASPARSTRSTTPTTTTGSTKPASGGGTTKPPSGGGTTKPPSGGGTTKPSSNANTGNRKSAAAAAKAKAAAQTVTRESAAALRLAADLKVAQAAATLRDARTALAATVLRAPAAGIVTAVEISAGGTTPDTAAITLRSSGTLVTLAVEEADIIDMKVGNAAAITIAAIDAQAVGKVSAIGAPSGGGTSGSVVTFPVTISVTKSVPKLRDGMSATVVITAASRTNVLFVPAAAIKLRQGAKVVRVLPTSESTKARRVTVTTGLTTTSGVQILTGLEVGALVVTSDTHDNKVTAT